MPDLHPLTTDFREGMMKSPGAATFLSPMDHNGVAAKVSSLDIRLLILLNFSVIPRSRIPFRRPKTVRSSVVFRRFISPLLALLLLPIPILCGIFGWVGAEFVHGELVHQSMMAYDRGLELTWNERFQIGILWLPFAISAVLWIWFCAVTLWHCGLQERLRRGGEGGV